MQFRRSPVHQMHLSWSDHREDRACNCGQRWLCSQSIALENVFKYPNQHVHPVYCTFLPLNAVLFWVWRVYLKHSIALLSITNRPACTDLLILVVPCRSVPVRINRDRNATGLDYCHVAIGSYIIETIYYHAKFLWSKQRWWFGGIFIGLKFA